MNTIGCGKMKDKKGFVFIETLVVVAILTASLLMLYSTYNAIIQKEKTRIKYNDSAYLYRTYYLEKFFHNFRLDMLKESLNKEDLSKPISVLTGFGCTRDIVNEEDNIGLCDNLIAELHINNLYFTYNNLSDLQNCKNQSGICEALVNVRSSAADYIKTIGGYGKEGYRIIVEFAETKDGKQKCSENDTNCQFYYTTLSLGDI